MTMEKNRYDILPTQSNINAYNRYPFKSYEDAVNNLKQKTLQPGEMAEDIILIRILLQVLMRYLHLVT